MLKKKEENRSIINTPIQQQQLTSLKKLTDQTYLDLREGVHHKGILTS